MMRSSAGEYDNEAVAAVALVVFVCCCCQLNRW